MHCSLCFVDCMMILYQPWQVWYAPLRILRQACNMIGYFSNMKLHVNRREPWPTNPF